MPEIQEFTSIWSDKLEDFIENPNFWSKVHDILGDDE